MSNDICAFALQAQGFSSLSVWAAKENAVARLHRVAVERQHELFIAATYHQRYAGQRLLQILGIAYQLGQRQGLASIQLTARVK